jgi:RNA polymerase sigma-70 factor (ECF subfamily)
MSQEMLISWEDWLVRHGAALLLLARQMTPSVADAEDALQEGFIRFWKRRDQVNNSTAYLFSCVRTAALDRQKLARRRQHREEGFSHSQPRESAMFQQSGSLEQDELGQAVQVALSQLPVEQREVIVMKIWGGLQFAEIGAALNISLNTAASRYRYAIEKLRALLGSEVSA